MVSLLRKISDWHAAREQRRLARWFRRMRHKGVVFQKPAADSRSWSDAYMQSLKTK